MIINKFHAIIILWKWTIYLVLPVNHREPSDPLPTFYPLRSAEFDWWMSFLGHYGYGIFHKRDWGPTIRAHVIVSTNLLSISHTMNH